MRPHELLSKAPKTTWRTCAEATREQRFAQGQLSSQGQGTYQSFGNLQRRPWSDQNSPVEDVEGEAPWRPTARGATHDLPPEALPRRDRRRAQLHLLRGS